MVKPLAALAALLLLNPLHGAPEKSAAAALSATALPAALSATAAAPAVASYPVFEPNHPVEDFFTVTIISTPFTAFWCLLGASVVAGVSQHKYPPEFDSDTLVGAGCVAVGASAGIGLVSAYWGRGKTPMAQGAKP